jgi:hypothetical protein
MEPIKLAGTFEPLHTLHTTGQFTNTRGELCTVTLELDTSDPAEHDYNVRSTCRALASNGNATVCTTTETVETFYSMKTAQRGYNWQLYVLAASELQEQQFKLGGYAAPVALTVQQVPVHTLQGHIHNTVCARFPQECRN